VERTVPSVHHARDAEDKRLLELGDHELLLAAYFHAVRERCWLRLRDDDAADEATQLVFLRLLGELRQDKRYPVPFRVVVWMVTEWTLRGLYPGAKADASLPDGWEPDAPDAYAEWEDSHDLGLLIADLPERQREVADLLYREGLSPEQIAERLGIKRNAVDQALHNAHRKLAEKLRA
jgi:RNA polymerase sigma factor (sigma-70 family)